MNCALRKSADPLKTAPDNFGLHAQQGPDDAKLHDPTELVGSSFESFTRYLRSTRCARRLLHLKCTIS
jgi:hypothetical protein